MWISVGKKVKVINGEHKGIIGIVTGQTSLLFEHYYFIDDMNYLFKEKDIIEYEEKT